MQDEHSRLIRQVRQRLDGLRRAGVDRLALPKQPKFPKTLPIPQRYPSSSTRSAESIPKPHAPPPESELIVSDPLTRPVPAATPIPPPVPKLVASLFDEQGSETPPIPANDRPALLEALGVEVAVCTRCPLLASTRTQTVFGEGNPTARLMFVGEAPGADEDRTGRPFVGRAGSLLTDMITKGMGLAREEVYIANILKSRPPENRTPLPDEVAHCRPYLERQIEIIRPEFLCLLGRTAASTLLDTAVSLGGLRRRWHRYRGIPTIVTYHPSYLLRNPAGKKDAWEDLKMLMRAMGLTPPGGRKD